MATPESISPSEALALIERLEREPPLVSVEAFDEAVRHWYWERKNVAAVRTIARAGIRRATMLADDAADPDEATRLRGTAKTIAYNLASFTWPGWDESGVTLTTADVADGRDAARLNLRLAILLGRPDKSLADAWWLIGAHALAVRNAAEAAEAFAEARAFAELAGEPGRIAMLDGYAALADSLGDGAPTDRFEEAIATLRGLADGASYVEQLETARRVFATA